MIKSIINRYRIVFIFVLLILLNFFLSENTFAQQKTIKIYPSKAPGTKNKVVNEKIVNNRVYHVYQPELVIFIAKKPDTKKAAVLIFPGGGYTHITIVKEGYKVAKWLNRLGISAFVLKYRLKREEALEDAERALSLIRYNSKNYNMHSNNIGIMGFSAGGHLALNLAEHYNDRNKYIDDKIDSISCKPDFMVLAYPQADSLANVRYMNKNIPPTFLVQAADDHTVPVQTSVKLFENLHSLKIPVELHIFENGGHGFGLGKDDEPLTKWTLLCRDWMMARGIISK